MKRLELNPRENWQKIVADLNMSYHSADGSIYWDESACYVFEEAEITLIESAANELHQMCMSAVEHVITNKLYDKFSIPLNAIPLIESSWKRNDFQLYGRFDFIYNQNNELKLLEYNADTPTSLFEASVVQWQWLEDCQPDADQFNFIHEQLILQWQKHESNSKNMHFACCTDVNEDLVTTEYLADLYLQANSHQSDVKINLLDIASIGWDGKAFTDLEEHPIDSLFKLYPWEWLVQEEFAQHIAMSKTEWIEPCWKMLLSNKALLPILWELYPDHEYLLPAHFTADALASAGQTYVKKPILGREGANVSIIETQNNNILIEESGPYSDNNYVYQKYCESVYDQYHPVLGVWMVGDVAAGMGIRENSGLITNNLSRFIPHYFRNE